MLFGAKHNQSGGLFFALSTACASEKPERKAEEKRNAREKRTKYQRWALGAGRWALGAGRWALGAGRWALKSSTLLPAKATNIGVILRSSTLKQLPPCSLCVPK
jgi:hypothetical protein